MKPQISAIIPCYNHGHLLQEKVREMEMQTLPPSEIIIIDDCSTDDSHAAALALRSPIPIRVLRNAANMQVPHTENVGMNEAQYPFAFMTACDDQVTSRVLFAKAMRAFERNPAMAFFCTASDFVNMDLGIGWVAGRMFDTAGFICPALAWELIHDGRYAAQGQTMVWRRDTFTPYDPAHRWQHDCPPPLIAAVEHGFAYDPECTVRFNLRSDSYSTAGRRTPEHAIALQHMVHSLAKHPRLKGALEGSPLLGMFGAPVLGAVKGTGLGSMRLTRAALWTDTKRVLGRSLPPGIVTYLHKIIMREGAPMPIPIQPMAHTNTAHRRY